ncbi:MAG: family 10 glycosylhydrolase, partial [Chloroflexota bacterium]|nr:family 10 glycosylhydrolase [Chloroflexota bacterium]
GYEDRVVEEFRTQQGQDAFALPNDDPRWLQFRADYVTLFLRELGSKVKAAFPSARFTTTIIAGEPGEYLKVLQDWPAWVEQGLIDEFHLWFRTTNDLAALARQTAQAAGIIKGRMPLVVELSCYHPGSFQEPDLMLAAARCARANGADIVGVYRNHAVEQLNFWPVLEAIGKL